ncbi:MAG: alkyldihydroxyacetonephosphate synthase [Solirubrobacteraceae bacterium]|jgi:alkyldihydroxyacetonephosphate synthase|nr:alkyldihydroxyacetonephosphate synthase [Solirubrobacteraceae bacterium]
MRWWGWGDPNRPPALPAHALDFLRAEVGVAEQPRPPVELEAVRLPDPALPGAAREALVAAVGAEHVRDDREARILHAAGKGYPDLVRQRAGDCDQAPDAVVAPGDHEQVRAVLAACAAAGVAVVPFGGGTSVVGGVEPLRGGFEAVISLDLDRLDRVVEVDRTSLTAILDAGLRGPEAEAALQAQGLTLGHFPQSYEYASIGGYVATRSAGQASTGYGRIDELVLGLRCATPAGDVDVRALPASAAGPKLRELLVGSEGTLGVITQAAFKVRPAPAAKRYEGWFFRDFAEGAEAFRQLEQQHAAPDVARLSDEQETRMSLALAGGEGLKARLGAGYLRLRGYEGGCLAILGWEGDEDDVARRAARSGAIARRAGGLALGRSPGAAWSHGRFDGPYLRDDLLGLGVMVETLETATQWSGLMALHAAVSDALRDALTARGTPPLVMCHVSHLYPSGASLYFTFLARQEEGAELEQWWAAKEAAGNAIVGQGATITHHHAIGRDHVPWMAAEVGEEGLAVLRAVKAQLDPAGIMNPGKLLPSSPA